MAYLDSGRIATATIAAPTVGPNATQTVTSRDVEYLYGASTNGHEVIGLNDAGGGGQVASYTYDEAGNMTRSVTHFGGVTETRDYLYDAAGQLRYATVNGQQELYYYLGVGQRVAAVKLGLEARLFLGDLELQVNPGTNAITLRRVYISHGTTTTRVENKTNVETILQSTLGHTLAAIGTTSGWTTGSFVYAPFGERTFQRPGDTHSRRINGKEEDAHTGLTYYGYRYYDPVAMIWTQGDPLYRFAPDVSLEEPRRQNLYTYSGNNPLRYVDPDGKDIFDSVQLSFKVVQTLSSMSSPTFDKVARTAVNYLPPVAAFNKVVAAGEIIGEVVAAAVTGDVDPLLGTGAHAETRSLDQMVADGDADVMNGPGPGVGGRVGGGDAAVGGPKINLLPKSQQQPKLKAKDRRAQQRGEKKTDGTPGNNQAQNKQFRDATRGLSKDQKRKLHDEISGQNLSYEDIKARADEIKAE